MWRLLQLVVLIAGCPKVCVILISELVLLCQGGLMCNVAVTEIKVLE